MSPSSSGNPRHREVRPTTSCQRVRAHSAHTLHKGRTAACTDDGEPIRVGEHRPGRDGRVDPATMSARPIRSEIDELTRLARPVSAVADLDPLVERIGDARLVLIGEASHGTSDFYRWRAELTKRLIVERGFGFVAVEGDWPDCFEVNCWLKNHSRSGGDHAREVLRRFERWPTWMWANDEVADFIDWLRNHNGRQGSRIGFYGLDVYSLWESIDRILRYLHDQHSDGV